MFFCARLCAVSFSFSWQFHQFLSTPPLATHGSNLRCFSTHVARSRSQASNAKDVQKLLKRKKTDKAAVAAAAAGLLGGGGVSKKANDRLAWVDDTSNPQLRARAKVLNNLLLSVAAPFLT